MHCMFNVQCSLMEPMLHHIFFSAIFFPDEFDGINSMNEAMRTAQFAFEKKSPKKKIRK